MDHVANATLTLSGTVDGVNYFPFYPGVVNPGVNTGGCPGFIPPYNPFVAPNYPLVQPVTTGWKCPGCGRCYAPGILVCMACEPIEAEGGIDGGIESEAEPETRHDGTLNRRIKA